MMFEVKISNKEAVYMKIDEVIEDRKEQWTRLMNYFRDDFINEECKNSETFCEWMEDIMTDALIDLLYKMELMD